MKETRINLIASGTEIQGKITFTQSSRIQGSLRGEIHCVRGTQVIVSEEGAIEGAIFADELIVDGFVEGTIRATKRVQISRTGRVVGDIFSPCLRLEPGAHFDGRSSME